MESVYGEGPYKYSWDWGDGSPYMEPTENEAGLFGHTYRNPGVYTVRVAVTNNLGTTALASTEVTIGDALDYIREYTWLNLPITMKNYEPEPDEQ